MALATDLLEVDGIQDDMTAGVLVHMHESRRGQCGGAPLVGADANVETVGGLRPARGLRPGDLLRTGGGTPVRVIEAKVTHLGRADLHERPDLRPVVIEARTLGNSRPLRVAPLQRLVVGPNVARAFDQESKGAAVRGLDLVGKLAGTHVDNAASRVDYVQIVVERQAFIFVEGIPMEVQGTVTRSGPILLIPRDQDVSRPPGEGPERALGMMVEALGIGLLVLLTALLLGAGAWMGLLVATGSANLALLGRAVLVCVGGGEAPSITGRSAQRFGADFL